MGFIRKGAPKTEFRHVLIRAPSFTDSVLPLRMQGIIKTGASGSGSLFFLFGASVLRSAHSGSSEISGMEGLGYPVFMSMETDKASDIPGKKRRIR